VPGHIIYFHLAANPIFTYLLRSPSLAELREALHPLLELLLWEMIKVVNIGLLSGLVSATNSLK
jgi:hypothetical protein